MRRPAVAGLFYPKHPGELRGALADALNDLPAWPGRRPRAIVVPHAGYKYSGRTAAHAYNTLAASRPETVVFVGPDHRGGSYLSASGEDWDTPLGPLELDADLHEALMAAGPIEDDPRAHAREHSIEVQLPFLHALGWETPPKVLCVAMGVQDEESADLLARALVAALRNVPRDAVLVASADLAHEGPNYEGAEGAGSREPRASARDVATEKGERLMEAMGSLDATKVLDAVRRHDVTSCGHGPMAAVAQAARELGASRVTRLAFSTSYDVEPADSVVAYGALAIE